MSAALTRFCAWLVLVLAFVALVTALAVATIAALDPPPIPEADPGPVQLPTALRVQPRLET